jgi:hypothetical protein
MFFPMGASAGIRRAMEKTGTGRGMMGSGIRLAKDI